MAEFEFIDIRETGRSDSGLTGIYDVTNRRSGQLLGTIRWFGAWRQYVFAPAAQTLYSAGCLVDVAAFMHEKRDERKAAKASG